MAQWHRGWSMAVTIAQNKLSVTKGKAKMKYFMKFCDDIPKQMPEIHVNS